MAKESPEHILIPKHSKLSEKETKELFERFSITIKELPRIKKSDPAIADLDVKAGDIVKIARKSQTAGKSIFYRGVVHG
jgi:DNA-directed RNA polymerase subunit H